MTATQTDGTELFKGTRTYMPVPQQLGRGTRMGRGPYEKSGLVEDTGLPPGRPVRERFEIPLPAALAGGGTVEVTFRVAYLPFGKDDDTAVPWRQETRTVTVPVPPGVPPRP